MTSAHVVTFADLVPSTRPADTLTFLNAWHGDAAPEALIGLFVMKAGRGGNRLLTLHLDDLTALVASAGLDDLVYQATGPHTVYVNVATLCSQPASGRGRKCDMGEIPGVWADFDCKTGSFATKAEIDSFIASLPVAPTMTVATGSGGVHAYWRFDKPVDSARGERACSRWWAYLSAAADGRSIDRVSDATRVMRLPGSIRWPKGDERPAVVRVVSSEGPTTTIEELDQYAEPAWNAHAEQLHRKRLHVTYQRSVAEDTVVAATGWPRHLAMAALEDTFNAEYSWDSVLLGFGWTDLGIDDQGRRAWSRPGGDGRRSATTDWPASPHVMSLFSTAPETGLRELNELRVPLTKYRVWVQLAFAGDEAAFVEQYTATRGSVA